jgi:NAD(P)-dependent dehydrogenase (short-subunit alcohol dehydrogenase family)
VTGVGNKLDGKVAVVTGAGSGIGLGIASALHHEGATVVAVDISGEQEQAAKQFGKRCLAVHADVTKASDVQAMLDEAISNFGRLDILCNNAGIDGDVAPIGKGTEENYDRVKAVNAKSVWLGMHYAVPIMVRSGGGSIINTASLAAMIAVPSLSPYCASKGAVLAMSKAVAVEYAKAGIRVNCICPGTTNTALMARFGETNPDIVAGVTAMTPMGRMAEPIEMGRAAVFLASDDSAFITGTSIVIDGGYSAI